MKEILNSQKTISIASINDKGLPHISYAPYVMEKNKIYIYISQVSEHYDNIENNKNVSLMVIKDEKDTKNLFGRNRVVFNGTASKISESPEHIKKQFEEIHGTQIMSVLYKMDFDFFEISITSGRLVKGFGQAYDLSFDGESWIEKHVVIDKENKPHNRKK